MKVKKISLLLVMALVFIACGSGDGTSKAPAASSTPAPSAETVFFDENKLLYTAKDYNNSIIKFSEQISLYPDGEYLAEAYLYIAKSEYWLQKYDDALIAFNKMINEIFTDESLMDDVYYWKARTLHQMKDFSSARDNYNNVLNSYTTSIHANNSAYAIAKTYYDEHNYNEAILRFTSYLSDYAADTTTDNAQYYLARAYQEILNYEQARINYLSLLSLYPQSVYADNAQYQLGKTYFDEATSLLIHDASLYNNAVVELQKVIALYPESINADNAQFYSAKSYHELALISGLSSDFDLARSEYAKLNSVNYPVSADISIALYERGKTYYEQADFEPLNAVVLYGLAIEEFKKVLLNFASSAKADYAQFYMAKSWHKKANIAGLDADFDTARLEYAKLNATTHLGSILLDNAVYETGKTYYEQAGFLSIAEPSLYGLAITEFKKVIDQFPLSNKLDYAHYYTAKSLDEIALISKLSTDFDLARLEYEKLNQINFPQSNLLDNARYAIGTSFYDEAGLLAVPDANIYDLAIFEYQRVLDEFPLSSKLDYAQFYIAKSHHAKANISKLADNFILARTHYNKVDIATYPDSTLLDNAMYETGMTHYDEANYLEARVEFDKVLATYPTLSSADNALYYKGRSFHRQLVPDYVQARENYAFLIANYPSSLKADNAQYYIALSYHLENNCVLEIENMQKVIDVYPQSSSVIDAQLHIDTQSTHTCS